jgi:hypothetical protein
VRGGGAAPATPADLYFILDFPLKLLGAIQGFQDLLEASDLPPSPFSQEYRT